MSGNQIAFQPGYTVIDSRIRKKLDKLDRLVKGQNFPQARDLASKLSQSTGGNTAVLARLGAAYLNMGLPHDAISCVQRGMSSQSDNPDLYSVGGESLARLGRYSEAIPFFERLVKLEPKNFQAWRYLTLSYGNTGMFAQGLAAGLTAISLNPGHIGTLMNVAFTCQCMHDFDKAEVYYRKVISINDSHLPAYCGLANSLSMEGKLDEAIELYQRVLERDSTNVAAIGGLAAAREHQGEYRMAWGLVSRAVRSGVQNPVIALTFARLAPRHSAVEEAIECVRAVLAGNPGQHETLRNLEFQLGKLLESDGQYDAAFDQYRKANEGTYSIYDVNRDKAFVRNIIRNFSAEKLVDAPRSTVSAEQPVFVVGMPRSGTTLTEQILDMHTRVCGAGEVSFIRDAYLNLCSESNLDPNEYNVIPQLTPEMLNEISCAYQRHVSTGCSEVTRIVDKLPHNFQHLGFINLLFPNTRIIHISRDPMDTCASIYCNRFSDWHGYSSNLVLLARHYRLYQALMRHWRDVLDIQILEIRYEELVGDSENQIRRIIDFCELPWEPACLEFYRNTKYGNTISYDQVRQPLNTRSIGRWRRFERQLQPLMTELQDSMSGNG